MTSLMDKPETFISLDVEADGPCPGLNSMLSIGAVACDHEGYTFHGATDFSRNLKPMVGASPAEKTMREFWAKFPAAWKATQWDQEPIESVMEAFSAWVKSLPGEVKTIIVNPSCFDTTYLYYYLCYTFGESPEHIGFRIQDIQSYASAVLVRPFPNSKKKDWPAFWSSSLPHTHIALEDAYEQLDSWLRIRCSNIYGFNHPYTKSMVLKLPRGSKKG